MCHPLVGVGVQSISRHSLSCWLKRRGWTWIIHFGHSKKPVPPQGPFSRVFFFFFLNFLSRLCGPLKIQGPPREISYALPDVGSFLKDPGSLRLSEETPIYLIQIYMIFTQRYRFYIHWWGFCDQDKSLQTDLVMRYCFPTAKSKVRSKL